MTPINVVDLCYSLAALVLMWIAVFVFWRDYRIDMLRHRLGILRDDLARVALSGGIPTSHPAITITRELIDETIQCADRFSWLRILCFRAARRSASCQPLETWEQALTTLPDGEARNALTGILGRWRQALVSHLLLGAPVPAFAVEDIRRLRKAAGWLDMVLPSAWLLIPVSRAPFSSR